MAAFENRPNSGALFATKAKTNPKAPDYIGDIRVDLKTLTVNDGIVDIKLSGWKKPTKDGGTFLSIAVDTFVRKSQEQPASEKPAQQNDDDFF